MLQSLPLMAQNAWNLTESSSKVAVLSTAPLISAQTGKVGAKVGSPNLKHS